jgi:hypothetical protein
VSCSKIIAALFVLMCVVPVRADLAKAQAEPNLQRRAHLALDNASAQMKAASEAYKTGDWDKTKAALEEMRQSVDLAYESLKAAGKTPRNSAPHKNLEIRTRELLKNFDGLRERMAFEERERVAPIFSHIQQVHDEVLEAILAPKKGK